ncbi:hypothetical protein QBC40DRAFT_353484 [Triangularia verruculosa]|uniref:Uncharacterized protein n=1 Tax=Triangularia verruculosa TaxID=2587418 RepID=A0AAN6X571_9PEZI|nr:hypothetical protein QBC40DRAFT_353484 [Triangularia verruculosa]
MGMGVNLPIECNTLTRVPVQSTTDRPSGIMKPEQAPKTVAREGNNPAGGDASNNNSAPRSPHRHIRGRHAPLMGTTSLPLGLVVGAGNASNNNSAPRSPHRHIRGRHAPLMGTTPLPLAPVVGAGNASNNVARESHHQHIRGRHPPLLSSSSLALPSHLKHVRGRHAPLSRPAARPQPRAPAPKGNKDAVVNVEVWMAVANAMM